MGWFVPTAQMYKTEHGTFYQPLPSSTDGCEAMNMTTYVAS